MAVKILQFPSILSPADASCRRGRICSRYRKIDFEAEAYLTVQQIYHG